MVRISEALRPAGGRVVSALEPEDAGAPYDRHARVYDHLIGNPLYNRVAWGTSKARYAAFAAEALAADDGPYLDVGCGTLVFTSGLYREAERQLVLADRSVGMLRKADERLADAPAELVQADIFALPFAPGTFTTIGCFAMLHVLDDPWTALTALHGQLAPGGKLYASMIVAARGPRRGYQGMLRRRGELGPLRSLGDLEQAARSLFGAKAEVERVGAFGFLRAER